MRTTILATVVITFCFLLTTFTSKAQNVGINTSSATPNASAGLDVDFTNKGLLIPRIALTSTTVASPITTTPATSLLVYNTATVGDVFPGFYYWNGTKWIRILNTGNNSGTDWSLTGNSGTTVGTNFLGTTDAQDLAIYTNNNEAIRINQLGNVGINNINPVYRLQVSETNGLNNAGIMIETNAVNGFASVNYKNDARLWRTGVNNADKFEIQDVTASAIRMTITTTGNIGIGTTAPATKLHVVGTTRISTLAGTGNRMVQSNANGDLTNLAVGASTQVLLGTGVWGNVPTNTAWSLIGNAGTTSGTNFLGTTDAQDLVFKTNGVENMRISSNGNIGIGTNIPSLKLHISGANSSVTERIENTNSTSNVYPGLQIFNYAGSTVGHPAIWLGNSKGNSSSPSPVTTGYNIGALIFSGSDAIAFNQAARVEAFAQNTFSTTKQLSDITFAFDTLNAGFTTPNEVMRIKSRGKVGIMNSTPNATLTIGSGMSGSVLSSTFITNAGNLGTTAGNTKTLASIGVNSGNFESFGIKALRIANGTTWLSTAIILGMDVDNTQDAGASIVLSSNGNVGIGTTTPASKLNIYNGNIFVNEPTGLLSSLLLSGGLELYRDPTAPIGTVNGYVDFKDNASDDEDFRIFYNNTYGTNGGFELGGTTDGQPGTYTTRVVILNSNGNTGIGTVAPTARLSVNGTANKPGGGSWAVFSDKRLKKNITDYNDGLNILDKVHLVNFQYNDEYFKTFGESKFVRKSTYQGVIAQELQKIAPYMVNKKTVSIKNKDGKVTEKKEILEVDPSAFMYMLINATKEQQKKIKALEKELILVKSLKLEVDKLKNQINNLENKKK